MKMVDWSQTNWRAGSSVMRLVRDIMHHAPPVECVEVTPEAAHPEVAVDGRELGGGELAREKVGRGHHGVTWHRHVIINEDLSGKWRTT